MQKLKVRAGRLAALCLLAGLAGTKIAHAQAAIAIPKLDLSRFTGTWYELERLPIRNEKGCVRDAFELIAPADKPNRLQLVNSCMNKNGYANVRNGTARPQNKSGDGKLKVSYLWPFSTKHWVLAFGPNDAWSLVGSPNHRSLWVLSRTPVLAPEVLAEIEAKAASEGYPTRRLIHTQQSTTLVNAH